MSYIENRIADLLAYRPELTRRDDFADYWNRRLSSAASVPLNQTAQRIPYPVPTVEAWAVEYDSADSTRIHGLLLYPADSTVSVTPHVATNGRLPCVINYHGFGGSKGQVSDFAHWILMGCAVFSIDIREQQGTTGSAAVYSAGSANSVATKGLLNRDEYYYGHVYEDCIRAIDVVVAQERIDPDRIALHGVSQGGGVATAVAALDDRPLLAMTDVPSNSNIERRLEIKVGPYSGTGAFAGVNEYLRRHPDEIDRVFETLSYFDTMNMADRIRCRILASVGLDDITCPPECYFATYNRIASDKRIEIYPFNGHEGGGSIQTERKIAFLAAALA